MICIVHQYDAALGTRRVRDYDNIETKRFLDVIESVFLTNDSGLLCSVLQTTKMGDRDATDFYLMLPESLLKWVREVPLNRYRNLQKNWFRNWYENRPYRNHVPGPSFFGMELEP